MSPNFSNKNLRGRSFRGQDLTDANFNRADIRGTDFSNAVLIGANFAGAKAGLQERWSFIRPLFLLFLLVTVMDLSKIFLYSSVGSFPSADFSWLDCIFLIVPSLLFYSVLFFAILGQGFTVRAFRTVLKTVVFIYGAKYLFSLSINLGSIRLAFPFLGDINFASIVIAVSSVIVHAIMITVLVAIIGVNQIVVSGVCLIEIIVFLATIYFQISSSSQEQAVILLTNPLFIINVAFSSLIILLSGYVGWVSLKGDERFGAIRTLGMIVSSVGGTNFSGANLTGADFQEATLRNTDFDEANLTGTRWFNARKIDFIIPGETYLRHSTTRSLVRTLEGKAQSFDRKNLKGINLKGAKLQNTSFVDTDLTQANLQGADLSGAILVRTRLEQADLTGANLTGACIEDWFVSQTTILKNVQCQYIFMKYVLNQDKSIERGDKRDQRPLGREFEAGEFVRFIRAIIDTVELYHDGCINPRAALTVLRGISAKHQEPLEIVGLQREDKAVILMVRVPEWIDQEKFKDEYNAQYERLLPLYFQPNDEFQSLISDPQLAELMKSVEDLQQRPTSYIKYFYNERGAINVDQSRNIRVEGDVVGSVLNLGELSGNVAIEIAQLPDEPSSLEQPSLKELLNQFRNAVDEDTDLSPEDKADLLEQIKALLEAKQSSNQSQKQGLVRKAKKIIEATLRGLPDTAKIVEACSKLLPMIVKALGFPT
jgi:uncharacterized protein YjbI with pentapeptide repeats